MSGYLTRDALLEPRHMPQADVELAGLGTVRVRGLTRGEVIELNQYTGNPADFEVRLITVGLVIPALTIDEVRSLQATCEAMALNPLVTAITDLSGLDVEAHARQQMTQFRHGPGE